MLNLIPKKAHEYKRNYGEYTTASAIDANEIAEFEKYDLKPVKGFDNYPKGLDAPPEKGIDHLYANDKPKPKEGIDKLLEKDKTSPDYVVVESKYNTSQLNPSTADGRQMSDEWVQARLKAQGIDIDEITFDKYVSRVDPKGKITISELNADGYVIKQKQ